MPAFHNISFPTDIGYGSLGGPGYKTEVVTLDSGAEERVARQSVPKHQFNVAYGVKTHTQLGSLRNFFHCRQGAAFAFRFLDHQDCSTAAGGFHDSLDGGVAVAEDDVVVGTGDGTETQFQLKKFYSDAGATRTRVITMPIEGTLLVAVNGASKTEGVDFTCNYATGVLTFVSAVPNTHSVTAGFEFEVVVRFSEAQDDWLAASLEAFAHGNAEVQLIEVIEEITSIDEFHYGGASPEHDITADETLTLAEGRTQVFNPTGAGHSLFLPDETTIPDGGPIFFLVNESGTYTMDLEDDDGVFVATLAISSIATVLKANDIWYVSVN